MTTDVAEPHRFDIGRVIQQTFAVLGRNIVTFSILGLILSGIPTGIIAFIQFEWVKSALPAIQDGNVNLSFSPAMVGGAAFGGLATVITTAILQGALIYATVTDLSGEKPDVGASLANGLRNFLGLIVVSILFAIACGVGLILLIVPGVIIACMWCVAAPALVADRTGIFESFSRSAELTAGNRWQIFGLGVILFVVLWFVSLIFNMVTGMSAIGAAGDPMAVLDRALSPLTIIMTVIQQTISAVLGATLIAVVYVELRRAREGEGPQWLAEIFR